MSEQAVVYFATLFKPDDAIELRPIDPRGEADVPCGKSWPTTPEEAVKLASSHEANGWNAYVGVYPRVARDLAKSGNESVAAMTSVWVEIDWLKLVAEGENVIRSGARTFEAVLIEGKRIAEQVLEALPVPTVVVASGAGYHVYWKLRERLALTSDDARARAQALLQGANVRARGDKGAKDLARILRVPGTTNWPNRRKRELGRRPVPTSLIHVCEDALYTLEELEATFVPPSAAPKRTSAVEERSPGTLPHEPVLDEDYACLHANAKLVTIWNGNALDGDRSRRDSRFALAALRDGIPEPVIARLLASMPGSKAATRNGTYTKRLLAWARTEATREPTVVDVPVVWAPSNGMTLAPVAEPWDSPIPLDQRREVEAFPVEALPEPFQSYALALAAYTATPMDMAGGLVLVAVAASALGKYRVRARWEEPTNVYFAAVAAPGERKSPVFRHVFRPIREFERDFRARRAPAIQQERSLRRALEKRRERLEKEIAEAEERTAREDAERRLVELLKELAQHPEPVDPRILVDDATPEALARMLAEQKNGVALLSTEGGVFSQMSGRYSKRGGANLDSYNKAYDGDPITVDRVGGGVLRAEHPHLVIGVTVQPGLVRDLSRERALRELGLLGRFLFAWPKSLVGYRADGPSVPHELEQRYASALAALLALDRDNDPLALSPEAAETFDAYRAEVERDLRPAGKSSDMADWSNKLCGKVLRIMGLLHLASHTGGSGPVPEIIQNEVALGAVLLGRYFTSHARAVFGLLGTDTAIEDAECVLAKIRAAGLATIKRSDLYEFAPNRFKKGSDVDATLTLLVDRRVLRPVEAPGPSGRGRPPTSFDVNPRLYTAGEMGKSG